METAGSPLETALIGAQSLLWTIPIALGLGLLMAVWLARHRHDRLRLGPEMRQLADGTGLSRGDLQRLDHLARAEGLACVGAMLISRGLFETCLKHASTRGETVPRELERRVRRLF